MKQETPQPTRHWALEDVPSKTTVSFIGLNKKNLAGKERGPSIGMIGYSLDFCFSNSLNR